MKSVRSCCYYESRLVASKTAYSLRRSFESILQPLKSLFYSINMCSVNECSMKVINVVWMSWHYHVTYQCQLCCFTAIHRSMASWDSKDRTVSRSRPIAGHTGNFPNCFMNNVNSDILFSQRFLKVEILNITQLTIYITHGKDLKISFWLPVISSRHYVYSGISLMQLILDLPTFVARSLSLSWEWGAQYISDFIPCDLDLSQSGESSTGLRFLQSRMAAQGRLMN